MRTERRTKTDNADNADKKPYKPSLCKQREKCKYGKRCNYAHTDKDLLKLKEQWKIDLKKWCTKYRKLHNYERYISDKPDYAPSLCRDYKTCDGEDCNRIHDYEKWCEEFKQWIERNPMGRGGHRRTFKERKCSHKTDDSCPNGIGCRFIHAVTVLVYTEGTKTVNMNFNNFGNDTYDNHPWSDGAYWGEYIEEYKWE